MQDVNLIPAYRLAQRKQHALMWRWVYGGMLYGLATVCACIGAQVMGPTPTVATTELIAEVDRTIESVQTEIGQVETQLSQAQRILRAGRSIKEKPDWSLLLLLLGEVAGDEVVLRRCELTPIDPTPAAAATANTTAAGDAPPPAAPAPKLAYELKLGAFATSQTAASQFVLRLEQTQLFDVVRLVKTTRTTYQEKNVFLVELECRIGEPSKAQP